METVLGGPIWSIWNHLSYVERLSFVIICALTLYSFGLAMSVMQFGHTSVPQEKLVWVHKHVRNLRQASLVAFCLWGIALCSALQSAFHPELTRAQIDTMIHWQCVFAANVFVVLLFLQLTQWFIVSRASADWLNS